jgi:Uma2 family endonuclease
MRSAPVKTALTFQQFLEFEVYSLERHEFVDGNLFVMAGGTDKQNHVIGELYIALKPVARAAGYRVYASDVLVRTPFDVGYYPDVYIAKDDIGDSARVKRYPIVIIEVLSDSTEIFDRGEKWQNYQTIPSLEQYVLLSQSEPFAEVYSRQSDGAWRYQSFSGATIISFSSIAFDLSLEALYLDLPVEG